MKRDTLQQKSCRKIAVLSAREIVMISSIKTLSSDLADSSVIYNAAFVISLVLHPTITDGNKTKPQLRNMSVRKQLLWYIQGKTSVISRSCNYCMFFSLTQPWFSFLSFSAASDGRVNK